MGAYSLIYCARVLTRSLSVRGGGSRPKPLRLGPRLVEHAGLEVRRLEVLALRVGLQLQGALQGVHPEGAREEQE